MNFVEFFGGSYFLAWCALWGIWAIVPIFSIVLRFIENVLYHLVVLVRGHEKTYIYRREDDRKV